MLVDYHVHGLAHGDYNHTLEDIEPFVKTAVKKGMSELGFTEHDRYLNQINFDLYSELQKMYPQLKIRIGLEIEFREGREKEFINYACAYDFDYTIGSVHEISNWPFDHPDHIKEYDNWETDKLYERYFNIIALMANTSQCQVVGHLDLIKVFGFRPKKNILSFLLPALAAIKAANMVAEINTNGWYKPVNEVYPAFDVLKECYNADIPITLSSDAHHPDQVGRDIDKANALAKKAGYTKVATFVQKQIVFQPL
ncbi:MAG: histidinol-phosphatase HisJ family protein [Bacillota bacterium]|nr:histidinol-phosphatase HisJ family protein [Bacillota bacterium]